MMKLIYSLSIVLFALSSVGYGQTEPDKKIPPIKMLPAKPGEVKHIYTLPDSTIYSVYDIKGKLVESDTAQFIDYTEYKPGTYFVKYDEVTSRFIKTKE